MIGEAASPDVVDPTPRWLGTIRRAGLLAGAVRAPGATPALAQADAGDGATCVGPLCLADLRAWLQDAVNQILTTSLSGVAGDIGQALTGFANDLNFLTRTPERLTYASPMVGQYTDALRLLANGLLAVVVLVAGYNVLLRPYLGGTAAGARELLPRLLLGAILINTAARWTRLAIDANNAACEVFGTPTLDELMAASLRASQDRLAGLLLVVGLVVLALLLIIQQLMRLALIDVLLILAPLAAVLWILPQTQAWARLWGRLFVGTVFAQLVLVLTLRLGFNLTSGAAALGAPGLLQPLLGIAVLALALKIPGLLGGAAAGGAVVGQVLGTAANVTVATGVGAGVRGALGVARGRTGARAPRAGHAA
jgi:hypothetical protein